MHQSDHAKAKRWINRGMETKVKADCVRMSRARLIAQGVTLTTQVKNEDAIRIWALNGDDLAEEFARLSGAQTIAE